MKLINPLRCIPELLYSIAFMRWALNALTELLGARAGIVPALSRALAGAVPDGPGCAMY